ncbi:MAG: redox-sensing transcriptional repressor Rex [Lachnospiraceae bacterium]|jgi:redox-sensing transcriptional repressor
MEENKKKNISKAVISRLPGYLRHLRELIDMEKERVSSEELSRLMKITASQVRQDLNHFGGFGQQGYGYNVKRLYKEIGRILGVEKPHSLIIIGSGNLGRALANYRGFKDHGFKFCGLFDIDEKLCGNKISGIEIMPMDRLRDFISENDIEIATIVIPGDAAKGVARLVYDMGIKNLWNFAHTELDLPPDAIVKNVHLLDSLLELSFEISRRED